MDNGWGRVIHGVDTSSAYPRSNIFLEVEREKQNKKITMKENTKSCVGRTSLLVSSASRRRSVALFERNGIGFDGEK